MHAKENYPAKEENGVASDSSVTKRPPPRIMLFVKVGILFFQHTGKYFCNLQIAWLRNDCDVWNPSRFGLE